MPAGETIVTVEEETIDHRLIKKWRSNSRRQNTTLNRPSWHGSSSSSCTCHGSAKWASEWAHACVFFPIATRGVRHSTYMLVFLPLSLQYATKEITPLLQINGPLRFSGFNWLLMGQAQLNPTIPHEIPRAHDFAFWSTVMFDILVFGRDLLRLNIYLEQKITLICNCIMGLCRY